MPAKIIQLPTAAATPPKQPKKKLGTWGDREREHPPNTLPDGRKRVRMTIDGKMMNFTGRTLAEAKANRDQYLRERAEAALYTPATSPAPQKTVADWADQWYLVYFRGSELSEYNTKSIVKKIKDSSLGSLHLEDVSQLEVQKFANANIHSKSYTSKIRDTLNRIMDAAIDNKLIPTNPCARVMWENKGAGERRALEPWEYDLITQNWHRHPAGIGAMLMLYTGERPDEARAQNWDNITDTHVLVRDSSYFNTSGQLVLKPCVTKTKSGQRDIPIMPQLADMLAQIERRPDELIWRSVTDMQMSQMAYRRNWTAFVNILRGIHMGIKPNPQGTFAGIRFDKMGEKERAQWDATLDITPYSLRHTFCTMLYDAGVDVKTMQYLMGHSNIETTLKVYAELTESKKKRAYDDMKAHFLAEKERQNKPKND